MTEPTIADLLAARETFTREQVEYLIRRAKTEGYWARVREENAPWPPAAYFVAGDVIRGLDRKRYRDERDAEGSVPHVDDYHGGPVDWETGRPLSELRAAA